MRPSLEIVVPVHNEQLTLRESIRRLHAHTRTTLPELDVRITIADNASTDLTAVIARKLLDECSGVGLMQLPEKGRGRALRAAWNASDADLVAYMDVDLSTDLKHLAPLVRPLLADAADIAIGSRLARGAEVRRSLRRELISRAYNHLLRSALGVRVSDAQCGFKAARRATVLPLLERVENQTWFFDTELLYLAEQAGLRIFELPVRWIEDRDSSVRITRTVVENLCGIARLRRATAPAPAPAAPRTRDHRAAGPGRAHG
jgi:glycosyltransferase involved in cell wall biosynthesis